MEKINDILSKINIEMTGEDKVVVCGELAKHFAVVNLEIFNKLDKVNEKARKIISVRDDFLALIGDVEIPDSDTPIENLHYPIAHAKSSYLHDMIAEAYTFELQEKFYSYGDSVEEISHDTEIDKTKFRNFLKDDIFKTIAEILTIKEKFPVYCKLLQYRKDNEVTYSNDVEFFRQYFKHVYTKWDYLKKFNKLKIEQFDNPFDIDHICIDFYLDKKYLGDYYIFKNIKPKRDWNKDYCQKLIDDMLTVYDAHMCPEQSVAVES